MPHMMPMKWILTLIFFSIFFLLIMMFFYFMFLNNLQNMMKTKNNPFKWNWQW